MTTFTTEDRANADTCLICGKPADWTRHTQFAGDHPYCDEHARAQKDFGEDDSYTFWTNKAEIKNILAGAEQQGDDDKGYRSLPCHTIYSTDGKPYLSVIHDDKLVKMRLHNYDDLFDRGIYFNIDRRALPELIKALEQVER